MTFSKIIQRMYEVLLEKQAERDLRKLPADLFERIIPVIRALNTNPRPSGCLKLKNSLQDYRVRVGEYRIIYEIDDKNQVVKVMRVRHRRESYR
ncbi:MULTISPECIES: type II toxin-antitoxin system RelE family toxin [Microcystis]|jgi:mRNA interferase RelE/StbE|uniref:Toxin RelE n=5 Tax=Microcystis TaxID=1125 RepID=A0A5A5R4V6_MICAE|nr:MULTISPECIES: type II toxin-antitoxin system RelE/ParE family toxin [Microcystis]AVQ72463.1 plasmid stabilization protein [Microcystis sp. MC19]KXS89652.1 plasmid stabilization protein [Microcystis aeruginosa NIES-88]MCA2668520.1 type II toxin-antitoxin system RelE/ParE family toxin [Microcystis sp. M045S2]MCA2805254.1 type II toxin-antitoxin system RelE/ParE family toxin [Microcystis sp. M114S2]MCA2839959.1 type II toxin-antitoxin system RelE/ParE family toxin [Microcystis sp. M078S1]MCA2